MLLGCSRIEVQKQPLENVLQKVSSSKQNSYRFTCLCYYLYLGSFKNFVTTRSNWRSILNLKENDLHCRYFQRVFPSLKNTYWAKDLFIAATVWNWHKQFEEWMVMAYFYSLHFSAIAIAKLTSMQLNGI